MAVCYQSVHEGSGTNELQYAIPHITCNQIRPGTYPSYCFDARIKKQTRKEHRKQETERTHERQTHIKCVRVHLAPTPGNLGEFEGKFNFFEVY